MKKPLSLAVVFGMAAAGAACQEVRLRHSERAVVELQALGKSPPPTDPRNMISEADYRRELARVRVEREGNLNAPPLSMELKQAILDNLINRKLLVLEAERQGVRASTVAVANEISAMRKTLPPKDFEKRLIQTYQSEKELASTINELLTAQLLLERAAFDSVKVTEDEARKLWESMAESEKVRPARVRAHQIVVRTEEEGRVVIKELAAKNADFAEIAKKRSAAPEAVNGGDLGWFEAGVMPSVFDEVCFALKPGEMSELTASEYGYHIFKVIAAEPERPLTYEDARPQLFEKIREERGRSAEAKYLDELRGKVKIVKNEELIASIE